MRLGPWEIIGVAGEGASARVWQARSAAGEAAIKVFHQNNDAVHAELELAVVARLAHPRVVGLLDFGRLTMADATLLESAPGSLWIAMEWASAGPLSRAIPLCWDDAFTAICQVLQGLAAAHGEGVVHQDVKPSNLLRHADGGVLLGDFGTARLAGQGRGGGTAGYASPEQIQGQHVEVRSDLYSVAATLWALLTGRPPHQHAMVEQTLEAQLTYPLPPMAPLYAQGAPPALEAWLRKNLSRQPQQRHSSAHHALDALVQLAHAPAPAQGQRSALWFRSRQRTLMGVARGPLIGRSAQLHAIDAHAEAVLGEGVGRVVHLVGPPACGARRLAEEAQASLVARGRAARAEPHGLEDPTTAVHWLEQQLGQLPAGQLLVLTLAEGPLVDVIESAPMDRRVLGLLATGRADALHVERVPPLKAAEMGQVVDNLVDLDPARRLAVIEAADGRPGWIRSLLEEADVHQTQLTWWQQLPTTDRLTVAALAWTPHTAPLSGDALRTGLARGALRLEGGMTPLADPVFARALREQTADWAALHEQLATQSPQQDGEHLLRAGQTSRGLERLLPQVEGLLRAGRYQQAHRALQALPTDAPHAQDALWRARMLRVRLARLQEDLPRARRLLTVLGEERAQDPWLCVEQAWLQLYEGAHVQALETLEPLGLGPWQTEVEGLRANLYFRLGRWTKAAATYARAREHFAEQANHTGVAGTLFGEGNVALVTGDPAAPELLTRAREAYRRAGALAGVGDVENSLGEWARHQGDLESACTHYQAAAQALQTVGSQREFFPRANMELCSLRLGTGGRLRSLHWLAGRAEAIGQLTLAVELWLGVAVVQAERGESAQAEKTYAHFAALRDSLDFEDLNLETLQQRYNTTITR